MSSYNNNHKFPAISAQNEISDECQARLNTIVERLRGNSRLIDLVEILINNIPN